MKPLFLVLHVLFFLSGVAGLGYQLVWTRMFSIGIGHEMPSILSVVAAFFGGLSFGSWALHRAIFKSQKPGLWMVGLEVVIGLWGLVSTVLIPQVNVWILNWMGVQPSSVEQWSLSFLIPFFTLLPATFCMGATLPAMERVVSALSQHGRVVGGLYGANTLGAVVGTVFIVFQFAPLVGFKNSLLFLAGINFFCALCLGFLLQKKLEASAQSPKKLEQQSALRLRCTLFLTGLLGIGYEVLCVRAMSQFLENTVYTFAILLVVYLLGTAIGAGIFQSFLSSSKIKHLFEILLAGVLATCLLGVAVIGWGEGVYQWIWQAFGPTPQSSLMGECTVAMFVFFLPTLFMGGLFSFLMQAIRDRGFGLGTSLSLNTLGATLAPFLFGVLLLPVLGVKNCLLFASMGYMVLCFSKRGLVYIFAGSVGPGLLILFSPWSLIDVQKNEKLIEYHQGVMASAAVHKTSDGVRSLKVDNRYQMGSTSNTATERRQAHLPLLLHPHPNRALFLGLGTGITLGAVKAYEGLEVDAVELVPEVVRVLPAFAPENQWPFGKRVNLYTADARRFVKSTPQKYDVIVADLFHPARDGAGMLYTVEHFEAVKSRLMPQGLFCQWLPLYQMDLSTLRTIVRTFLNTFPNSHLYLGNLNLETPGLALVGFLQDVKYGEKWLQERVQSDLLEVHLKGEALHNVYNLFSGFFATTEQLRVFGKGGLLNTDDRPAVLFGAPAFLTGTRELPSRRLDSLMHMWSPIPPSFTESHDVDSVSVFASNLKQVLKARDLFLQGAIEAEAGNQERAYELYLQSAGITLHFQASYAFCLEKILQEYSRNPKWSRWLTEELIKVQPLIGDAKIVLEELFSSVEGI